jgi:DNA processing protein
MFNDAAQVGAGVENPLLWLRLIRSRRVGPTTFHRLVAEHGSVTAALAALPAIAAESGVEGYQPCPETVARAEMAAGRACGARLVLFGGAGYPAALKDLPDAPPVLWAKGNLNLLSRPMVALVGARNASSLGLRMARRLAEELGQAGHVVVSGLARGIDAAAHQGALSSGTIAVLAGGVDVIYPEENATLAKSIAEGGLILSEQPPGLQPQTRHFPVRNRIISGLARAVVVVEAAAKSGSLITARNALDQGREVLAVPGHPMDARASGCNMLIRDGAQLVRAAADVLAALGPVAAVVAKASDRFVTELPGPVPKPRAPADIAAAHARILGRLGPSPMAEDQLLRDLDIDHGLIAPLLLQLELEGRIERQAGGLMTRLS